jgi:hypothetical protein
MWRPLTIFHRRQLQAFLGIINFYCRFVPAAASVLLLLTEFLKGGKAGSAQVEWSPAMRAAFNNLSKLWQLLHCWHIQWLEPSSPWQWMPQMYTWERYYSSGGVQKAVLFSSSKVSIERLLVRSYHGEILTFSTCDCSFST